jgi:hypothetical protein
VGDVGAGIADLKARDDDGTILSTAARRSPHRRRAWGLSINSSCRRSRSRSERGRGPFADMQQHLKVKVDGAPPRILRGNGTR